MSSEKPEFKIELRRRDIRNGEILADLRNLAKNAEAQTITKRQYEATGKFSSTLVLKRFGSWNDALKEAGLQIGQRRNIPEEELLENIGRVWLKLGKQPSGRDMSRSELGSEFPLGTYKRRYKTWNAALTRFGESISSKGQLTDRYFINGDNKKKGKRTPRDINWRLRAKILIRDNCICQMCGDSPAKNPECVLHVDHIIAWANGGETVEENLQTLCDVCNIGKSNAF